MKAIICGERNFNPTESLGLKVYRFDENTGHFKFISHIEEGD